MLKTFLKNAASERDAFAFLRARSGLRLTFTHSSINAFANLRQRSLFPYRNFISLHGRNVSRLRFLPYNHHSIRLKYKLIINSFFLLRYLTFREIRKSGSVLKLMSGSIYVFFKWVYISEIKLHADYFRIFNLINLKY